MKKTSVFVLLFCVAYAVIADNVSTQADARPITTQVKKSKVTIQNNSEGEGKIKSGNDNADIKTVFKKLDFIICRQMVDMQSNSGKESSIAEHAKYFLSGYLKTLSSEDKEQIRSVVLKQIELMDKHGIEHDPDEKEYIETHPVDMAMIMILSFNHQALNGYDNDIYSSQIIEILKGCIYGT